MDYLQAPNAQGWPRSTTFPTTSEEMEECAMSVSAMQDKVGCSSLNALCCEKAGKDNIQGKMLPPPEDAFLRCVYQLLIWRPAVVPEPDMPGVTECGYERKTNGTGLMVKMLSQSPAAPDLLNDLLYDCESVVCASECSCLNNGQPCVVCVTLLDGDEMSQCANHLTSSALVKEILF